MYKLWQKIAASTVFSGSFGSGVFIRFNADEIEVSYPRKPFWSTGSMRQSVNAASAASAPAAEPYNRE